MLFIEFLEKVSGEKSSFNFHIEIPISPLLFRAAGLMDENENWILEGKARNSIEGLILLMYLTLIELHFANQEVEIDGKICRGCYVSADLDKEPEKVNPLKEIFMKNRIATVSRIFQKKMVPPGFNSKSTPKEKLIFLNSKLEAISEKEKNILFEYLFDFHPFPHMFVELYEIKEIENKWIQLLVHCYNEVYNDRLRNGYLGMREIYNEISKYVEEKRSEKRYTEPDWRFGTPNFSLYASGKEYNDLLDFYWLMNRIWNFYSDTKNKKEEKDLLQSCEKRLKEFTELRNKENKFLQYKFKPENILGYKNARFEGQHETYKNIFPQSEPEKLTEKILQEEISRIQDQMMEKNIYTGDYQEYFIKGVDLFYKKNFKSFISQERKIEVREKISISDDRFNFILDLANQVPKNPLTLQEASSTFNRAEAEGPMVIICNNPVNPENSFHPNSMLLVLIGLRKELEGRGYNYYTGYTQKDAILIILKLIYIQYIIESDHILHMKMYLYYLSGEFQAMLRKYKEEKRANRVVFELISIVNEIYEFASNGKDLGRTNELMDARLFQKADEKTIDILFRLITNADLPIPEEKYELEKILRELPKDNILYQGFQMYYNVIYGWEVRWSRNYLSKLWKIRKLLDYLRLHDKSFNVEQDYRYLNCIRALQNLRKKEKGGEEKKRKIHEESLSQAEKELKEGQDLLLKPAPVYSILENLYIKIKNLTGDYYSNQKIYEEIKLLEKNFDRRDKNEILEQRCNEIRENGRFLIDEYNTKKYNSKEEKRLFGEKLCNPIKNIDNYFCREILEEESRIFYLLPIFERFINEIDIEETEDQKKKRILEEYKEWSLYVNVLENRLKNYCWVFNITEEEIDLLKREIRIRAKLLRSFGMEIYEETPEMKLENALILFSLENENPEKITPRQIITAYRRLALKHHPDRASLEYDEHLWNDIQRANELLMEKFGVEDLQVETSEKEEKILDEEFEEEEQIKIEDDKTGGLD